jgi:hypothetical protein
MVSLWYPGTGPTAPYVTPPSPHLILAPLGVTGIPPEILSTTLTHFRMNA